LGEEYTGESMTATEKLQKDASEKTNAAVSEGKDNVDHAKAVGSEYVEQVKELARSAIGTAQVWFLFILCTSID
jgi:isocitrate lyase